MNEEHQWQRSCCALQALGFEVASHTWEVTAGRSLYYSDDPEERGWRNRWPRTWLFRIAPATPLPKRSNELFEQPASLGLGDETWNADEPAERADVLTASTAFVIVDFRKPRAEIEQLMQAAWASAGLRARPSLLLRELANDLRQLHLTVGDLSLPDDVPELEVFLAACKAAGGTINWRWRLTWPTKPSEPLKPEMTEWLASLGLPPKP